ncbi:MAG: hypothetical protein KME37_01170 [Candidatus Thiodiazotropha sp. (ex Codakia orbicularis)]|nr:hypothetical protein [Candidatus Thiodiazotropha sp. (ex Codakia orbicularis)]
MQGRQKRSPFAVFSLALILLWIICFSSLVHAADQINALWVAESTGVIKVATADGSVLLEIEDDGDPRAVSVDQANAKIWVYGNDILRAYGFDGVLLSQTQVSSVNGSDENASCQESLTSLLNLGGVNGSGADCFDHVRSILGIWPVNLVVGKNDGEIWLSVFKTLYQFDHTGTLQNSITFDRIIRSITHETTTNRLWVAVANQVVTTTPDGSTTEVMALGRRQHILDVAYDDNLNEIWVVTGRELQRYTSNGVQTFDQSLRHLRQVTPDGHGGVWLAGRHRLYRMDASGLIHFEMGPFQGLGLRRLIDIVADETDHTVWVANKHAIKHIDRDGQILHTFVMEGQRGIQRAKIRDLAIYTDAVAPELSILSPSDASYINSQQPQIALELVDDGSGVDVESLEILAEGETLPVECSGTLPEWVCTPTVTLEEGPVSLSVTVADNAGNRSEPVVSTFTIDTQQPEITLQSPVDGLLTNQPELTVSGSVSEAATVTLNGEPITLTIDHTFSETLTLTEGNNEISLQATDLAGNVTDLSVLVVLDTLSPAPVDLALIQVSDVVDGKVTVTGDPTSVEPEAKVTIKNRRTGETVTTTANSDGSFILLITAEHSDELSILVTDQAGNDSDEAGTAVTDVVPGVGTIPPDPAQLAPPLSPSAPVTLFAASEFLYNGTPPIQTGVDPTTISKQRVAVVRGLVLDRNNHPLPGVKITIKNHAEFGQTLTRRDGMLDMAVNGGGLLTINYEKAGYLPVQRKVDAPWQDYVWAEDVVMIRLDEQVSNIDLSNPTAPMQVAQGSTVTDEDGARQATILFPSGTTATMTMPDGSTQPLTTLNVRATEYTVGENGPDAMPAPLPPTSAYTYAVELSADEAISAGAKRVDFNQQLPLYVDNFLNFPVGIAAPVGYYDFDLTAWVPSDNGLIVQILGIENGRAVLDVEGGGEPVTAEGLETLGINDQELVMLAGLYESGKELWRTPVTHFTPFDINFRIAPPEDAEPPVPPPPPPPPEDDDPEDPECENNSIIECQSQVLGESIPIANTGINLNYRSSRVPGKVKNKPITTIPLSGSYIPESLRSIHLDYVIAGKRYYRVFQPESNLTHTIDWDSQDAYGRPLVGLFPARISTTYVYDEVYYGDQIGSAIARLFARWGSAQSGGVELGPYRDSGLSGSRGRLTSSWSEKLPATAFGEASAPFNAQKLGTGGWSMSIQHNYDPDAKKLHLGSGKTIAANNLGYIITAYAPTYGNSGKGAVDAEGNVYITESDNNRVTKISPSGLRTIIAGNGLSGFSGDGGPAVNARLDSPADVSLGINGEIYIADQRNDRIRMIDQSGIISTVAGNGIAGYSGDEELAVNASLNSPSAVVMDSDGMMYIADAGNHRIRRVSPDGVISTYAGNDSRGFSGDGGAAIGASLNGPSAISVDQNGYLYIVDRLNQRIRKVGSQGIITTVAGTGVRGFSGDGGIGTEAQLDSPSAITPTKDGGLYISDLGNRRIRYLDAEGNIKTVAGNGLYGDSGDLGPAINASMAGAVDMLLSNKETLYFIDSGNRRIRAIGLTMEGYTGEGYLIPSSDGKELYEFDEMGRHLRTMSTITGADLYTFSYEGDGFVNRVTDGYGNQIQIERDINGTLEAFVSPDNHRTTVTLDANGYLYELTNPNDETYRFGYTSDGLLTTMVDPEGHAASVMYNERGRLIRDENPAGGVFQLERSELNNGYRVELTSLSGQTTRYDVQLAEGQEIRQKTRPDGVISRKIIDRAGAWGKEESHSATGLSSVVEYSSDQRFGWLARHHNTILQETPSGGVWQSETSQSVSLDDVTNPLSLISSTDTRTINGRTRSVRYVAENQSYTYTSPEGRNRVQTIDTQGSLLSDRYADLATVYYDYNSRGRLSVLRVGEGLDERRVSIGYGQDGYIDRITDPLDQVYRFNYDPVGRVTEQIMPDGRSIGYRYDATGNLTAVIPAGRSAHLFEYTPIGFEASYTPPDIGSGAMVTRYFYNLDKQLTRVERPDGVTITLDYEPNGRRGAVSIPRGVFTYTYDDQTGQLTGLSDPTGGHLNFAYDGPLFLSESWASDIIGVVERQYDNNFWITGYIVNNELIDMNYDQDGLLTRSGDLSLVRNSDNGLVTATGLGEIDSITTYNGFGEKESERYTTSTVILDGVIEGQSISADRLQIAGRIGGAGTININGLAMQVETDGSVVGEVPLPIIGENILDVEIYDQNSQLVGQFQRSVIRERSQTDFNISRIVEMAPNGDIYFFNEGNNGQELLRHTAGSGTTSQPDWLNGAIDLTVSDSGEVYLLKGLNLTVYDGVQETSVLDLASMGITSVSDIEIGLDEQVYVLSGRDIYRVASGALAHISTLPDNYQEGSLEHSAWGLVVNGGEGNFFYRIHPDGTIETLINSQTWVSSDYALSDDGVVCWVDEGPVCTVINDPQAPWDWLHFFADSMEFGLDGALYYADIDNLFRYENGVSTPILSGSQGTIGILRLSGSLGNTVYSVSYVRDKLGRISEKTETIEGVTTNTIYGFDINGRLETVTENGVEIARYQYDANGNRTHVNSVEMATYDEQDRLLTHDSTSYSYTESGELTEKLEYGTTTQFTYDELGNLIQVLLPDNTIINYIVDGRNRRVGKRINGELVQGFLYKDQLNPIAEMDGVNNLKSLFVYGSKINVPDYVIKDGVSYRIVADHLGSPRLVVNASSGEIVQRIDYDAWGKVLLDTNPGFQPFYFAGGIYDQHIGLLRYGARDYDPETGRWTDKDPIRFNSNQLNMYEYAINDPVNMIDSNGRDPYGGLDGMYYGDPMNWFGDQLEPYVDIARDYGNCIKECVTDAVVGEAYTTAAEKGASAAAKYCEGKVSSEVAKKILELAGKKVIPVVGQASTAASAAQGVSCFYICP